MKLLIDIGNTRIKYAFYDAKKKKLIHPKAFEYTVKSITQDLKKKLLFKMKPEKVVCANVAGKYIGSELFRFIKSSLLCECKFVHIGKIFQNLKNGYQHPEQLGVDRWLLLIATITHYPQQAVMIISLGTTITLDYLDPKGEHQGGFILPGLQLMQDSIAQAAIGCIEVMPGYPKKALKNGYAKNTEDAIHHGSLQMLAAFLNQEFLKFKKTYPQSIAILTGGAAKRITPYLNFPCDLQPWWVLEGMAKFINPCSRERKSIE